MLLSWLQLKVDEAKEMVTDQWKDLEEEEKEALIATQGGI